MNGEIILCDGVPVVVVVVVVVDVGSVFNAASSGLYNPNSFLNGILYNFSKIYVVIVSSTLNICPPKFLTFVLFPLIFISKSSFDFDT